MASIELAFAGVTSVPRLYAGPAGDSLLAGAISQAEARTSAFEEQQNQSGNFPGLRKQSGTAGKPASQGNLLELPPTSRQSGSPPGMPIQSMQPQSHQTLVLPAVFRGCWEGRVARIDSLRQLAGPPIGSWVTKTYRICYQRVGDGPFQPTLSMAGLDPDSPGGRRAILKNVTGSLEVLSTDGRSRAKMRALLGFDECHPKWSVDFLGRRHRGSLDCSSVKEVSYLDCLIEGGQMRVKAQVDTENDGRPWAVVTWHTDFMAHASASDQ